MSAYSPLDKILFHCQHLYCTCVQKQRRAKLNFEVMETNSPALCELPINTIACKLVRRTNAQLKAKLFELIKLKNILIRSKSRIFKLINDSNGEAKVISALF